MPNEYTVADLGFDALTYAAAVVVLLVGLALAELVIDLRRRQKGGGE